MSTILRLLVTAPLWLVAFVAFAPSAAAHDGPPYAILVDEVLGDYVVSIWADPDVGTGTFFYYLTSSDGRPIGDVRVDLSSSPHDGLAPQVASTSEPARPGEPFQQVDEIEYAHRGTWSCTFVLRDTHEPALVHGVAEVDVEVTPPGSGLLYLVWYAIPFVAIGAMWLRALVLQRRYDRSDDATT